MSNVEENNKIEEIKSNLKVYFKGIKSEWGKITWPQKNQVVAETIVVLIVVTAITLFVYLVDIGFKALFQLLNLT